MVKRSCDNQIVELSLGPDFCDKIDDKIFFEVFNIYNGAFLY